MKAVTLAAALLLATDPLTVEAPETPQQPRWRWLCIRRRKR